MNSVQFIRTSNDPVLRLKAKPVMNIKSPDIRSMIVIMRRAMEEANGIGIAAPQIGISLRIFLVADFPHNPSDETQKHRKKPEHPLTYINPVIREVSGKIIPLEEGCLSVPETFGMVPRRERVIIDASNEKGGRFRIDATGLLAHVFQHEMDHLNGLLFTDKAIEIFKKGHIHKHGEENS